MKRESCCQSWVKHREELTADFIGGTGKDGGESLACALAQLLGREVGERSGARASDPAREGVACSGERSPPDGRDGVEREEETEVAGCLDVAWLVGCRRSPEFLAEEQGEATDLAHAEALALAEGGGDGREGYGILLQDAEGQGNDGARRLVSYGFAVV